MTVGSLFAGIGGFDLAARWMGWQTAWFSEIEPYASAVLKKHWPTVPNHGDITQINGAEVERVDILCGGFPCQDISLAGKGAGLEGARSGLWLHYARLIDEIRPRYVVAENVSALRSRGLDRVLGEIAALGYDAEWHCIPASAVGAPHRRDRIWIVAYPCGGSPQSDRTAGLMAGEASSSQSGEEERKWVRNAAHRSCEDVPDSHSTRLAQRVLFPGSVCEVGCTPERQDAAVGCSARSTPDVSNTNHAGQPDVSFHDVSGGRLPEPSRGHEWWFTEPNVGRVAHGVPRRVDRLRCLGNTIVPQVAYKIFQAIDAHESGLSHA